MLTLSAWAISYQWRAFASSDRALVDFAIFRSALLAMEKISAERGPMNAALGEALPIPEARMAALRRARQESDASLQQLRASIGQSHCARCPALSEMDGRASTTLAQARNHADDVIKLSRPARSAELLDEAVNRMAADIPIVASIADAVIEDIVKGDATVLNYLQMARLSATLREQAGLLGSRFTGALASNRPLTDSEQQKLLNSEGRVEQLRGLLASHGRNHPTLATLAVHRVNEIYGGDGLDYVAKVYHLALRPEGAGISTGQFAEQYVPTMSPIVALRNEILEQTDARLQQNRNVTLYLMLGAFAVAVALAGAMLRLYSLFRHRILKPFSEATQSILAIAKGDLTVNAPTPGQHPNEIRALLEAVQTLKLHSLDRRQLEEDRQRLIAQLTTMAETDALTQLLNRHALEKRACELCAAVSNSGFGSGAPYVALLMFDIDYFKLINDTYGHIAGDRALEIVGRVTRDALREGDLAARFGGEEFAVVGLVESADDALALAERLRDRLSEVRVEVEDGRVFGMTVSLGIAVAGRGEVVEGLSVLVRQADAMLYRAKRNGRDRVEVDWGAVSVR